MFLCRNASDCNEHHDVEIASASVAAEHDVASNSEDLLQHVNSKILKANFLRFCSKILTMLYEFTVILYTPSSSLYKCVIFACGTCYRHV